MEEQACPRCKTTKYRNPSLKLMVNVCGHALCENCVELLFVRGSGACPQCDTPLRRSNFRLQLFEDAFVEKEVDIRKRILKDFNKKEDDFATLREYNDYLEEIETIVFNLTNGIDVEETKWQIERYKKENQDSIKKNRSKLSKDEELLEELIETEKQEMEFYREQVKKEEIEQKKTKLKNREALIDDLMFSDLPADHILNQHRKDQTVQEEEMKKQKPTTFSTGIRMRGSHSTYSSIPKEEAKLYVYNPFEMDLNGPDAPQEEDLLSQGYINHVRSALDSELGGGFVADLACKRALQEAFSGLFFSLHDDLWTKSSASAMDIG